MMAAVEIRFSPLMFLKIVQKSKERKPKHPLLMPTAHLRGRERRKIKIYVAQIATSSFLENLQGLIITLKNSKGVLLINMNR